MKAPRLLNHFVHESGDRRYSHTSWHLLTFCAPKFFGSPHTARPRSCSQWSSYLVVVENLEWRWKLLGTSRVNKLFCTLMHRILSRVFSKEYVTATFPNHRSLVPGRPHKAPTANNRALRGIYSIALGSPCAPSRRSARARCDINTLHTTNGRSLPRFEPLHRYAPCQSPPARNRLSP